MTLTVKDFSGSDESSTGPAERGCPIETFDHVTDPMALRSLLVNAHWLARTHALRTIARQTTMLDDALHAIRAGRTEVATEFVERVIDALRAEHDYLAVR